jgi:hypothetical protein
MIYRDTDDEITDGELSDHTDADDPVYDQDDESDEENDGRKKEKLVPDRDQRYSKPLRKRKVHDLVSALDENCYQTINDPTIGDPTAKMVIKSSYDSDEYSFTNEDIRDAGN